MLALVLGAAIAAAVVLAVRHGASGPPAWSSWKPVGSSDAKVDQIRSFVSDEYKLPNGDDFAAVRAGPPTDQGVPASSYVIRRPTALHRQFDVVSAKSSIVYTLTMCGVTLDCTRLNQTGAAALTRTLRREALELALYTFKYVGEVESVSVDLPALTKNGAAPAVFFQKSDLAAQLERPLRQTLPPRDVVVAGQTSQRVAATVDELTVSHLYQHTVTQDASGAPAIILDPVQ